MERFSIDYITRHSQPSTYLQQQPDCSTDAVIQVSNHDGLLTHSGSNFLHTSLHLEDVYSVISKDVAHMTSPLVNDVTNHVTQQLTDLTPVDSSYSSVDDGTSPLPSPEEVNAVLLNDITPIASPSEVNQSHDRNTPSPQKDSGIDSDNSPVSSADVEKKLNALEKKAKSIQPTNITSKKSKSSDKPPHSYIALIAQAILSTRDRKCALGEIYRHIAENYEYYNNEEKAWRNSIRYNLSINECFVKAGKDESTGKGNLWAIHPACVEDFEKGDYRRRQARRRARRTLKGIKSETDAQLHAPTPVSQYTYQAMTPSYVSYHPYSTPAYMGHQQYQRTDSENTYNTQSYPQGAYYSNQYPQVSQYSAMSTTGQIPSSYGYSQPELSYLHRPYGYDSVEIKSDNNGIQNDNTTSKWYTTPDDSIPDNNTVVIS